MYQAADRRGREDGSRDVGPFHSMGEARHSAARHRRERRRSAGLAGTGREQPDVLLTDIGMPKMNGLALIEAFKAHKPDIRCIILSGLNEFEHARQGDQASSAGRIS